jgi:hypothetical protein
MNEEADVVSSVMFSLHLPEHIQNRIHEYYDDVSESMFIKNPNIYSLLSFSIADFMKLYQIRQSVNDIDFINSKHMRQIENFVTHLNIGFYMPEDIIIKQGENNKKFYYIHEGLVEVAQHDVDFEYFNFQQTEKFFETKFVNSIMVEEYKDENGVEKKVRFDQC